MTLNYFYYLRILEDDLPLRGEYLGKRGKLFGAKRTDRNNNADKTKLPTESEPICVGNIIKYIKN